MRGTRVKALHGNLRTIGDGPSHWAEALNLRLLRHTITFEAEKAQKGQVQSSYDRTMTIASEYEPVIRGIGPQQESGSNQRCQRPRLWDYVAPEA